MKKKSWDESRARQLYDEGRSDLDIADMVGATEGAIKAWRARNRLHSNSSRREQPSIIAEALNPANTEAKVSQAKPEPHKKYSSSPLDAYLGPIDISLSYAGCQVSLSAPDQDAALRAMKYLDCIISALPTK